MVKHFYYLIKKVELKIDSLNSYVKILYLVIIIILFLIFSLYGDYKYFKREIKRGLIIEIIPKYEKDFDAYRIKTENEVTSILCFTIKDKYKLSNINLFDTFYKKRNSFNPIIKYKNNTSDTIIYKSTDWFSNIIEQVYIKL